MISDFRAEIGVTELLRSPGGGEGNEELQYAGLFFV